jgi:transcriptional regulator
MYTPQHFEETRLEVLHALMQTHPLATLITTSAGGPVGNHLPLEIDPAAGALGTIRGHLARANPAWRDHRPDSEVLVIFQGPQAYISPSWYPTKRVTGQVVPTWNYAVVHAYGPLRLVHDTTWLRSHVGRMTDRHESQRPAPWHVDDAPRDYIEKRLQAIVGFEIPISRIHGKWKMSQNRTAADQAGVVSGLRESGGAETSAVARIVESKGR